MNLVEKLGELGEKVGISPKISVPFLGALLLLVVNWVFWGDPLDVDQVRLLVGGFVVALLGIAAPPAVGTTFDAIKRHPPPESQPYPPPA